MNDHTLHTGWSFYAGLLEALTQVMGSAKGYLIEHGPRSAYLARQIARRMGFEDEEIARLVFAGVLADVGMIGLVEDAWEDPRPGVSVDARDRVRRHPARSEAIVLSIPHLETLGSLVRHHHEWWDGSGYPDGSKGDDIPVGAQILRLADTVCALGEWRPHRPSLSLEEIQEVVERSAGQELSPDVVAVYRDLVGSREIAEFHPQVFRRWLMDAACTLLPPQVSPLSSGHLLEILASLIDAKDSYTAGHSRRVAILSVAIANQLGLEDHVRATLWAAGYLHDLGKVRVPLRILTKRSALKPWERVTVEAHPTDGARILEAIPSLRHLAPGTRYHHERWDGQGYPEGLRGEHIPLVAQILAVADAYDAMTSKRTYRDARSHDDAMAEIAFATGRHFGPAPAAAFLALPDHLFESVRQPKPDRTEFFQRHGAWGSGHRARSLAAS